MTPVARPSALLALSLLLSLGACSASESKGAPVRSGDDAAGGAGARGAAGAEKGGGGGGGAAAGRAAGGRGGPAGGGAPVVLSATDVGVAQRGPIEAGVPVTGDLRPIESVDVKARIEGDLTGVFVREGQRVNRGQLLARIESSQQESGLRSAQADRESARSELAVAQWNAEQSAELFKAGAIPERDNRAAQQAVVAARARLAATESQVRSTSSSLTDTRVIAPTTGVIERRLVENGEHVARGASLFSLVRNDVLELAAALPSRLASTVRTGQPVHFIADGRPFDGRVARVSPTVDPTTRAVTVYVQVPNADGTLRGNTFASGRVVGQTIPNALLVPTGAIRQSQDSTAKPYVYRVADDRIVRSPVEVGVVDEAKGVAEITDGLREGDRIVVGNVGSVGEGMRVQVVGEKKS